jgi:rhamnulose-1-phosphate aldolase/alcohol dehydrogenase
MKNLWSAEHAARLDEYGLLVYVSNLLGMDTALVQGGGGNTSLKRMEKDFVGRDINVMRVKASGHQLSTIKEQGFAGVRLEEVTPLFDQEDMTDDEMVRYISHVLTSPDSPRPSIETLLHAFIPFRWVLHSHADAILSFANNVYSEQLIKEVLGEDMLIVPYNRPGFMVAKQVGTAVQGDKNATGLVLLHHGLVTWSNSCEEAYERHIDLVERAEVHIRKAQAAKVSFPRKAGLPVLDRSTQERIAAETAPALRGALSSQLPMILTFDNSEAVLEFANTERIVELSQTGPVTPEHVLSTKPWPLVIQVDDPQNTESLKSALRTSVRQYEERYMNYFHRYQSDFTPHNPVPRLVIVPGIGIWGVGTDVQDSRLPVEIYKHTLEIIKGAEAIGKFQTMPENEVFSAEYWPMELYKLSLRQKPKELNGKVAVVTGAAKGIGFAVVQVLLREGACVVLTDVNIVGLVEAKEKLGSSFSGRVKTIRMDVTNEQSVKDGIAESALYFGGVDVLVSNTDIVPVEAMIDLPLKAWERSFAVNATGHFLVSREAMKIMLKQENGGSIVFINTKNAPAPGKDFGAYSCTKGAEAQLCRILAIEHGKDKIRVNMINPDGVFTDLWSPEMVANRANAYDVPIDKYEDFLRDRTLLKESVTVDDVAEAALYLASDKSRVTTGCIISVDGGAREAFPR